MILFQASASHNSLDEFFDQLNFAFKCILVNAGFLAAMYLFN